MELKEFDKFLMEFFELFIPIERIVENNNISIKELNRPIDHENNKKIYSKSNSTLRRELNKIVDSKYLTKESGRYCKKENAHFVYNKTDKLQEILILMLNRLSSLINRKIDDAIIERLDIRSLEDLIFRRRQHERQKTEKASVTN